MPDTLVRDPEPMVPRSGWWGTQNRALGKTWLARGCIANHRHTHYHWSSCGRLVCTPLRSLFRAAGQSLMGKHRATRSVTAIALTLVRHPQRQQGTKLLVTAGHFSPVTGSRFTSKHRRPLWFSPPAHVAPLPSHTPSGPRRLRLGTERSDERRAPKSNTPHSRLSSGP